MYPIKKPGVMIPAHAEAVKNIKNAAANNPSPSKQQALSFGQTA